MSKKIISLDDHERVLQASKMAKAKCSICGKPVVFTPKVMLEHLKSHERIGGND